MAEELEQIEVHERQMINFEGSRRFECCLKFRRGKIVELWLYHTKPYIWHWTGKMGDFSVMAYCGREDAEIPQIQWCLVHKTPCLVIYAPKSARCVEIDWRGLSFWDFEV